jgi:hypothetical protein
VEYGELLDKHLATPLYQVVMSVRRGIRESKKASTGRPGNDTDKQLIPMINDFSINHVIAS